MSYDVLEVCRHVINYSNEKEYGISNLKLQKVLYFIQAYFLIDKTKNAPCFDDKIEAWNFGPVVPAAYHEYKQYGSGDIPTIESYILFDTDNIWNTERVKFNDDVITDEDKKALSEGTVDYIGFSYYMSNTVNSNSIRDVSSTTDGSSEHSVKNPYIKETDWGWAIDPEGLRYVLNQFYERYELPMFIVENGFGAIDKKEEDGSCHDSYRIDYLRAHIEQMKKAVEEDGVNLMGYTPWGCIDCISFTTGEMKKRYGFIYVDRDNEGNGTLERSKKDSYEWYKKVIASNGEVL